MSLFEVFFIVSQLFIQLFLIQFFALKFSFLNFCKLIFREAFCLSHTACCHSFRGSFDISLNCVVRSLAHRWRTSHQRLGTELLVPTFFDMQQRFYIHSTPSAFVLRFRSLRFEILRNFFGCFGVWLSGLSSRVCRKVLSPLSWFETNSFLNAFCQTQCMWASLLVFFELV